SRRRHTRSKRDWSSDVCSSDLALYERVEKIAAQALAAKRQLPKPVCANVDFYSGFVYTMLRLPQELFTAIFAIARISGWCAHRKIGRASCRESGELSVVGGRFK